MIRISLHFIDFTLDNLLHILPMFAQLPLLRWNHLEETLDEEDDILQELTYPDKRLEFYSYLSKHCNDIKGIISFHLGAHKEACKVAEEVGSEFMKVSMHAYPSTSTSRPNSIQGRCLSEFTYHRVGEAQYPGNSGKAP